MRPGFHARASHPSRLGPRAGGWMLAGWLLAFAPRAQAQPVSFAREVRPILERSCYGCHGPEKQKSGYRLDVRAIAINGGESGEAAIVAHAAARSPLIRYVSGEDEEMLMPPKKSDKPRLTPAEIATLRSWIDTGPAWPDEFAGVEGDGRPHWSLLPLVRPAVPAGAETNPIDAFIRAKLTEQRLAPSPAADARTLIRRLTFDLTGLPPTPEEVEAFVRDAAREPAGFNRTYAKLVDRLLASPRYGEHWARHWLDVAHYADTHGNDHDHARPNAWPYRDYVIRALNEDRPYARFVQEQVAGDALFPDDPRAVAALGFLAAGPWDETLMVGVREDTVDHRMAQNLDRDDMVTTVMSTFQSLTVHCARCHNHKFDPIAQRDYYALQAVFAGADRSDRPFDADPATHARRRELMARKFAIDRRVPAVLAALETSEMTGKIAAAAEALAHRGEDWTPLDVVSVVSTGAPDATVFARQSDASWLVSGARPEKDTFIITATTKLAGLRALRLELLPDASLPHGGPGRSDSGNFQLTEFHASAQPAAGATVGAARLEFSRATADHSAGGDVVTNAIDGRKDTHWNIHGRYGEAHEAVFELKETTGYAAGTVLVVRLDFHGTTGHQAGRFRLSACTDALNAADRPPQPATSAEVLRMPDAQRTPEQRRDLALRLLGHEVQRKLAELPAPQTVYAVTRDFAAQGSFKPSLLPREIHLLERGELGKPGELVAPGTLGCVPGMTRELAIADPADESSRRAALARWLSDDRNALTWRSIVNRVWHYDFGRGLCDSPNDFGKMGGAPSHPELLDWLAVWFRDEAKGSFKALQRLIVTSATYRQSVGQNAAATERDADSRLLWRRNRRRLTGEEVRDAVLQLSGQLDLTMGGPPAVQFVARGKATFTPDGGAPAFLDYENFSPDEPANRRRAVYRFVFRTIADPLMDALDVPDGGSLTPVRGVSTTALQAFALLNDAFLIRQCERLAERVARGADTPERRVVAAFRLMLQRAPDERERARFAAYVRQHGLANACHVILNSNEFLHLD